MTEDTQTLKRAVELYDPRRHYDVRSRDVTYREGERENWLARVYEPQGKGPFPAVIEIHGGAWSNYDRTQNAEVDQAIAASGLVVAAIDFRLASQAPYPASIADVNYAVRWLKTHAERFNATPDAIGVLGFSSGGHMAMLAAMRPSDSRYTALPLASAPGIEASLAYVVLGWPVLDPHARYLYAKGLGRTHLVEAHHRYFADEATMREANPQLILERGERIALPPVLIVQGAADDVLSPQTAERFVEAYGRAGGIIELALYPGAGHAYTREGSPHMARTVATITAFIERQFVAGR